MIPDRLNLIWIGPPAPPWVTDLVRRNRVINKTYDVRVHGEEVLLPAYRRHYAAATDICQRSDLLRYSALQRYGGWYLDCDFLPLRPLADAGRAYGLDATGSRRMLVTEQHWQHCPRWTIANGVLAATADCPAWEPLNAAIAATDPATATRVTYGPALMVRLVRDHPDLFVVAGWPLWYPLPRNRAVAAYRAIVSLGRDPDESRRLCPETHGELPWAIHLWQGGSIELPTPPGLWWAAKGRPGGPLAGVRAGVVATHGQWLAQEQPFRAIADGLVAAGCQTVEVHAPDTWPMFSNRPNLVVVWNGRREPTLSVAAAAEAAGAVVLRVEHGFFDRRRHSQIDHRGILHWASWATPDVLAGRPPADGESRLAHAWPHLPPAPAAKRSGYVLVLGQCPGDTQLGESDIRLPIDLVRMTARSLPPGTPALFRPHPLAHQWIGAADRFMTVEAAGNLADVIASARLAVTINSNAGNEALALGCPVAAVGPALYLTAGLAHPLAISTFRNDLLAALDARPPDPTRVRRYLRVLAAHQHSPEEFRTGAPLVRAYFAARPQAATAEVA